MLWQEDESRDPNTDPSRQQRGRESEEQGRKVNRGGRGLNIEPAKQLPFLNLKGGVFILNEISDAVASNQSIVFNLFITAVELTTSALKLCRVGALGKMVFANF